MVAEGLPAILLDLKRFAQMLTRHPERSADLIQDTCERALARAHLFDGRCLRAWCFQIMHNIHVNTLRRFRLELAYSEACAVRYRPETDGGQESAVLLHEVMAAGRRCRGFDAELIALDAAGLTIDELCAHYGGLPTGTIKSRVSRSRKALRAAVQWEAAA